MIAIGVAAVALFVILIMLATRGGDDDGAQGDDTDETTPSTATIAEGYTQDFQDDFMSDCEGSGASADACRCSLDALMEQMPLEEFEAAMQGFESSPGAPLPAEIESIVAPCREG